MVGIVVGTDVGSTDGAAVMPCSVLLVVLEISSVFVFVVLVSAVLEVVREFIVVLLESCCVVRCVGDNVDTVGVIVGGDVGN